MTVGTEPLCYWGDGPIYPGALPHGFDHHKSTLFIGPCGSGKTEACRAALYRWRGQDPVVWVVDSVKLARRWGVQADHMAVGVTDALALLKAATLLLEARRGRQTPRPLVVVIEELPWLLDHSGRKAAAPLRHLLDPSHRDVAVYGTLGRLHVCDFPPFERLLERFQIVDTAWPGRSHLRPEF